MAARTYLSAHSQTIVTAVFIPYLHWREVNKLENCTFGAGDINITPKRV